MGSSLLQALIPLFFVLALGFAAGRYHAFNADQATGFNTLLIDFALPAMLFSSTVTMLRSQLLSEAPIIVVMGITYLGLFLFVAAIYRWFLKRSLAEAAVAGLLVASPAAPFFGPSVVTPIYGAQSGLTIAVAALVINVLQVPLAIIFIGSGASSTKQKVSLVATVGKSLKQPVVIAPVLALVLVLFGITLPQTVKLSVSLIGSATSGVAVFVSGLTLAAHRLTVTRAVLLNALGKLILLPVLGLGMCMVLGVAGELRDRAVLISALSSGFIGLILASRYKIAVDQAASTVLLTVVGMALALPLWIMLLSKS